MHINAPILRQQVMQDGYGLIKPLQIRIQPASPGVAVGFLLDDAGFLGEGERAGVLIVGGVGDGGGEGEVGAGVERRVDVDEVPLAGELVEQGRQDVLLVASDEAVAPGVIVGPRTEQRLAVARRFVDGFDALERQLHAQRQHALAVGVVLAVPTKLRGDGHRCVSLRSLIIAHLYRQDT